MNEMHSLSWPGPKGHRSRFLEGAGTPRVCTWRGASLPGAEGGAPASWAWTPHSPAGRLLSSLLNYPSLSVSHACAQFHSAKCSKKTGHR